MDLRRNSLLYSLPIVMFVVGIFNASCKSFFIKVVFPAPRKPEIISIFVIV
jgi:hypothetical protein